jgi:Fic family protein
LRPRTDTDGPAIQFNAQFTRYRYPAVRRLARIERALGLINAAPLLPAAANQLRASARAGTVHYSTLIEGNELPLIEAERAALGELDPTNEAKVELINYVAALDLIDERHDSGTLRVTPQFLLDLQGTVMKGLGRPEGNFRPHHEGAWRDGRAIIPDSLGGIVHEGSAPDEVPGRIVGLCGWIEERESRLEEFPPPVIAAVVHYAITEIHPFANGNGRTARLAAAAILLKHDYLPGRLFSFEAYYARDRDAYLAALRSVRRGTYNMEPWLEYYLEGLAEEYERVVADIEELNRLGLARTSAHQLSASQQRALSALAVRGQVEFARADYQSAAGVSRSTANRDIDDLLEARVLRRVPATRGSSSRYAFAGRGRRTGRPRKWTPESIERELREFTRGREDWPRVREFDEAGRRALYLAVSRNGGADHWAQQLGLNRE